LIDRMVRIYRHDSPWIGGYHPKNFALFQSWLHNAKANEMSEGSLKYLRVDSVERAAARAAWNRPVVWPVVALLLLLAALIVPAIRSFRRRERMAARPAA
jgi:hypothetical protein